MATNKPRREKLNLPYLTPSGNDLIRLQVIYDRDSGQVLECVTPSGKKVPLTSNVKKQLHAHIHNCQYRY